MKKIIAGICYFGYYLFARHLPGSDLPYSLGSKYIRRFFVRGMFKKCGRGVNIERGAFFGSGREIEIGDYSGLGLNCRVSGPLKIGRDVMMGPGVMIFTQNHGTDDLSIPMRLQTAPKHGVTIGDGVWIGANALIMPGVNIGRDSIIGGGAVVTKDVPDMAVAAGNPARVIKYRGEQVRV